MHVVVSRGAAVQTRPADQMATFLAVSRRGSLAEPAKETLGFHPTPGSYGIGGSSSSRSGHCGYRKSSEFLATVFVAAWSRRRSRLPRSAKEEVRVKETEEQVLDYDVPSREELEKQQIELLEATGALDLQRKEEAYQERRKWKDQNPSPLDKWQQEMEEVRNDTERRMLWGDLQKKSGGYKRYRGKKVGEEEGKMKFNRGFPLEDTEEQERTDQERDRKWLEMWRSTWPEGHALDPHDPESFGFAFVGEVTGAHGVHGDVRVRADDFLCDQGYDPATHLARRNFSNFTEDAKRVHLKAPHRRFPRPFRILTGKRVQRRVFALRLHGVESPEEAVALRGYKVYVLEPPPTAQEKAKEQEERGLDLYDAGTTTFHTSDALGLIGSRCVMVTGQVTDEVLGEFAAAETADEAKEVLAQAGAGLQHFGDVSAVVPDYKIARRHRGRKAAHDLLDITLINEVQGGEGQYLYEPDPESPTGQALQMDNWRTADPNFERVVYVPFVPDTIARVDADRTGSTVYFRLPGDFIEKTAFTCRKRIVDERGLLVIPRGPFVKALLPPEGKSHALRRRDGKRLPLHGTAPAAPADMLQPAGQVYPETSSGVPRPPMHRPFGGLDRLDSAKNRFKRYFKESSRFVVPLDLQDRESGGDEASDETSEEEDN
ncbi:unnamed protein product [Symbiodinium sp. CCMP2456]|nr:unnamed protein product [Symbiodinium sp. CCMP2456]